MLGFLFILRDSNVYITASSFVFLWYFYALEHVCLCIYMCVSGAFSLALFQLFVLSYSGLVFWFGLVLVFHYYSFNVYSSG